jgi:hexosaminidase
MKTEGLKDENELQTYFVNRMSRFIESHGRKVIGWDEVLEGGIPEDVIIMSWRGEEGAIHAVNAHHYAIMTPNSNMYFDYYQGVPESEPVAIGGFLPLNRVYDYNPIPASIPENLQKYILGVQGNLWTEYISTPEQAEYMAYPRVVALSEIAWSQNNAKNYSDFLKRLSFHFVRLDHLNVNYSKSHYSIKAVTGWLYDLNKPQIALSSECKDCDIRYTLNGDEPSMSSSKYNGPIIISNNLFVKAQAFRNGVPFSPIYAENFILHKGTGKPYQMENVNPGYSGGHQFALTDGIVAKQNAWNRWVGTLGKDMDVKIDLLKPTTIRGIKMQFFHSPDSWIYAPLFVEFYTSVDGKIWTLVDKKDVNTDGKANNGIQNTEFITNKTTRFIRIVAKSIGKIPENAQGAGNDAHLFCNEIIVN